MKNRGMTGKPFQAPCTPELREQTEKAMETAGYEYMSDYVRDAIKEKNERVNK